MNNIYEGKKQKKEKDIQNPKEIILAGKHLKYDYKYYDQNKDINIIFKIQAISKKVIFYQCNKRPKCKGTDKLKLLNEVFKIIKECDSNIFKISIAFNVKNKFIL